MVGQKPVCPKGCDVLGERETDRQRETERETETDRQTQTDRGGLTPVNHIGLKETSIKRHIVERTNKVER